MTRMKIVPAEATVEMLDLQAGTPIKYLPKGKKRAETKTWREIVGASPHSGKVSREAFAKARRAVMDAEKRSAGIEADEIVSEVLEALGLEFEK